jgi:hypothetical protein
MKGKFDGFFTVKSNQIRIVFQFEKHSSVIEVFIHSIDYRGNIY